MKITNEELKFKIYNSLKKDYNEEINEDELKKVKNISINQVNEVLEGSKIEVKELEILKYVEILTLNFFEINDELIEEINLFDNLNCLILNHCNIRVEKKITRPLKNIIIAYSKNFSLSLFKNNSCVEMLELINLEKVDIKDLINYQNLKYIYIYNTPIENLNYLENFEQLEEVHLDGSTINNEVINHLKEKNIKVYYSQEYLPN